MESCIAYGSFICCRINHRNFSTNDGFLLCFYMLFYTQHPHLWHFNCISKYSKTKRQNFVKLQLFTVYSTVFFDCSGLIFTDYLAGDEAYLKGRPQKQYVYYLKYYYIFWLCCWLWVLLCRCKILQDSVKYSYGEYLVLAAWFTSHFICFAIQKHANSMHQHIDMIYIKCKRLHGHIDTSKIFLFQNKTVFVIE